MAVEKLTCPNCGASIGKYQQKCTYCGSSVRVKHDNDSETGLAVKAEETLHNFMDTLENTKAFDNLPQIIGITFGVIMIVVGVILSIVAVALMINTSGIVGAFMLVIGLILAIVGMILCILVHKALKSKKDKL
jgi:vacuolar-type H+-ATPase subunit I/STV1